MRRASSLPRSFISPGLSVKPRSGRTRRTLGRIERLYWYTLEFGVALEGGEVKAYGAGLLSSYGELGDLGKRAALLPFDLEAMARTPYDPTDYQKVLFVAPSFGEMVRRLEAWLAAAGGSPENARR